MSTKASPASRRAMASWRWWCVSFGFLPIHHPARLRALSALADATADKFALELGQTTQHGQHEPAVLRGGVGPHVPQRLETGALIGDGTEHVEEIASRLRQPVEPGHHQTSSRFPKSGRVITTCS
jgi:hypothetical protein